MISKFELDAILASLPRPVLKTTAARIRELGGVVPNDGDEAERLLVELERKANPTPVVQLATELPLPAKEDRLAKQAKELFEEQRESIADHNRRVLAEMRRENEARLMADPSMSSYQRAVDGWIEMQRAARMYERRLRRELDPCRLGIWGSFEGNE
jgi:hypothetical protein